MNRFNFNNNNKINNNNKFNKNNNNWKLFLIAAVTIEINFKISLLHLMEKMNNSKEMILFMITTL